MTSLRIACVGDLMVGDLFYNLGRGVASGIKARGESFLRPEIVDLLASHDIVMCNLECVLSDVGRKGARMRSLQMRGTPGTAAHLARWGVTVANLANNHILEHGIEAAVDTARQLEQAGIKVVGAGTKGRFEHGEGGVTISRQSQEVTVLGLCLRREKYAYEGGLDLEGTLAAIRSHARTTTVIVSVHWGDEWVDRPSVSQVQTAQRFVEAGAALIVGHHPHVMQGVSQADGRLIAYSLGNFIFGSVHPDGRWSAILSVELDAGRVTRWTCHPVVSDEESRPYLPDGRLQAKLQEEIQRRCQLVPDPADLEGYAPVYESHLRSAKQAASKRFRRAMPAQVLRSSPIYWPQVMWRPIRRRLGAW